MSAKEPVGKGHAGLVRSKHRASDPPMLGRKSVLMGMLTSGFVIANAAQPSATAAGTVKPGAIAATTPTYLTKWAPSQAYVRGQQVVSSNNDVVSANVAHTSGSTFNAANWSESSTFGPVIQPSGGDDTAALNAAIGAVPAGKSLTLRGVFTTTGTVTVNCHLNATDATINYSGSGTAVRVGTATSGAFLEHLRVLLPKIFATAKTNTGWAQVAGSIGVDISNIYACQIEVPLVRNFETGMRNYGKGKGNCHNTVLIGHLNNNKVNQLVTADATGWSNQNLYLGGQFDHDSAEGSNVSGARHIELGVTANPVNSNMWVNSSLEGDTPEFQAIIAGTINVIDGGRWEVTGGARVKWASDATGNLIRGGYDAQSIVETFASGASGSNDIDAVNHSYRTGGGGTKGVMVLENQSSTANPALMLMEAGARAAKSDPATAYAGYFGADHIGMKRATDTYDRLQLDAVNGRYYFGAGTAAPTIYLAMVGSSGIGLTGGNLYFGAASDIGLDATTLLPRDVFLSRDLKAGGVVKSGRFATGSRPSASSSGAGAMIYDSTLSKPIWSNGSVWKDATGTTV